jgi:hypothetical protein
MASPATKRNVLWISPVKLKTYLSGLSGVVADWPFQDVATTYAAAINPAVTPGRNLVLNGTFDTDTLWTKGTGWDINTTTAGKAHAAAALANAVLKPTTALPLVIGKSYSVTYDVVVTLGTIKVQCGTGANGTTRSVTGTYTETLVCATDTTLQFNPVATFTGDIDNVIVQQLNILASTAFPGADVMTDGSFEASTIGQQATGWSNAGNHSGLVVADSSVDGTQAYEITATGAGDTSTPNRVSKSVSSLLTLGRSYLVTWYAVSGNTTLSVNMVNLQPAPMTYTLTSAYQKFALIGNPYTANSLLQFFLGGAGVCRIDKIVIQEFNPLNGAALNGVVQGASISNKLGLSYTFDGVNDNVGVYSASLNSAFNPLEGTLMAWAKVSAAGVWADSAVRRIATLLVDTNNYIAIEKTATANQLKVYYVANGTASVATDVSLAASPNPFQVAITWSKSGDAVKMVINGAQVGATQTGLGTWVGNLASTKVAIGAADTSGTNPWSGSITQPILFNRALTAGELALASKRGGTS